MFGSVSSLEARCLGGDWYSPSLAPGVHIGVGAIVAAASVVTRDVPLYAVIEGNPASIIRMRYSSEVISELLHLCWWDWPMDEIEANLTALSNGDMGTLGLVRG